MNFICTYSSGQLKYSIHKQTAINERLLFALFYMKILNNNQLELLYNTCFFQSRQFDL